MNDRNITLTWTINEEDNLFSQGIEIGKEHARVLTIATESPVYTSKPTTLKTDEMSKEVGINMVKDQFVAFKEDITENPDSTNVETVGLYLPLESKSKELYAVVVNVKDGKTKFHYIENKGFHNISEELGSVNDGLAKIKEIIMEL